MYVVLDTATAGAAKVELAAQTGVYTVFYALDIAKVKPHLSQL
jgi:hypothetical protein